VSERAREGACAPIYSKQCAYARPPNQLLPTQPTIALVTARQSSSSQTKKQNKNKKTKKTSNDAHLGCSVPLDEFNARVLVEVCFVPNLVHDRFVVCETRELLNQPAHNLNTVLFVDGGGMVVQASDCGCVSE
jgi:hypothetical protein